MKLGIIGLGRSGKTTIFNALTGRTGESVPPGGQVTAVLGVVPVPDERVDRLSDLYRPQKTTHAQVTYMDLQGLSGGIENKQEHMAHLLNHMRPMDAFLVVVRNFRDPVLGAPRAAADLSDLEDEFILTDLATVEKRLEKLAMEEKRGKKVTGSEKGLLESCREVLDAGKPVRSRPELATAPELRGFTFLSGKPVLVIFNNEDEDDRMPEGPWNPEDAMVVRGKLEMEMTQLSAEEVLEFQKDFGIGESALNRVIERSFNLLRMVSFFTVGEDEVKAWTIPRDLPALEAAGSIHSDIQRGFIRAEVVAYNDLRSAGDYATARKQGTVRLEGKLYPVQDGDVIHFRFNV